MIPILNIYYMLAYSFQVLNENGYQNVKTESFENLYDLYASILIKGVSLQIKRGLVKEYSEKCEEISSIRGKIDMTASMKPRLQLAKQVECLYDDLSVNTYMHQIIKSTLLLLLRIDVSKDRKKRVKKLLYYFNDVDVLELSHIKWKLKYNKTSQTYQMLISICYLIISKMIQSNTDGYNKMMDFMDEQRMSRLYEKFILEYYRKEYPSLSVSASQVPWQLDDETDFMLPTMQTDITITDGLRTLIIDAKYYKAPLQERYESKKFHSSHLYQIFTYVKNKQLTFESEDHVVSGMLLYAKTNDVANIDTEFKMSGNSVHVRTLDLNCEFKEIKRQLEDIVSNHFLI